MRNAAVGGEGWRKSGKFTSCSYSLTYRNKSWQPVVDAADAIRVTIEDMMGTYDNEIVRIEYRVINSESKFNDFADNC